MSAAARGRGPAAFVKIPGTAGGGDRIGVPFQDVAAGV
jgi:hypothetical protein